MCNLYTVRTRLEDVVRHFGIEARPALGEPGETTPRAPGLVVRASGERRTLHEMDWGFPRLTREMRAKGLDLLAFQERCFPDELIQMERTDELWVKRKTAVA